AVVPLQGLSWCILARATDWTLDDLFHRYGDTIQGHTHDDGFFRHFEFLRELVLDVRVFAKPVLADQVCHALEACPRIREAAGLLGGVRRRARRTSLDVVRHALGGPGKPTAAVGAGAQLDRVEDRSVAHTDLAVHRPFDHDLARHRVVRTRLAPES